MKILNCGFVFTLYVSLFFNIAFAQLTRNWNYVQNQDGASNAIKLDINGNTYSGGRLKTDQSYLQIVKLDPNGVEVYRDTIRSYQSTNGFQNIIYDGQSSVYALGDIIDSLGVEKLVLAQYDTSGYRKGVWLYDSLFSNGGLRMAADSGVFFNCFNYAGSSIYHGKFVFVDTAGNKTELFDDRSIGLISGMLWYNEVDSAGDIYMAGSGKEVGVLNEKIYLIKMHPSGITDWTHIINGNLHQNNYPSGLHLDDHSDLLLLAIRPDTGNVFSLIKYDLGGSLLWDQPAVDRGKKIITDKLNNIYLFNIAGTWQDSLTIIKLNSTGNFLHSTSVKFNNQQLLILSDKLIDDHANLFIAVGAATISNYNNLMIAVFDSSLGLLTYDCWDTINNAGESPSEIIHGNNNEIYITGFANQNQINNTSQFCTLKYSLSTTVGINESGVKASIKIYPNPVTGSARIELPDFSAHAIHIIIRDILGKIVFEKYQFEKNAIVDLNSLKAGIYFLQTDDSNLLLSRAILFCKQ